MIQYLDVLLELGGETKHCNFLKVVFNEISLKMMAK